MEIVRNIYYDVYYNPDDPKEVKKAKAIRKRLEARGFSLEAEDAHDNDNVCDQFLNTKFLKN